MKKLVFLIIIGAIGYGAYSLSSTTKPEQQAVTKTFKYEEFSN